MYKTKLPETVHELANMLADAATMASRKTLIDLGLLKPYLKMREAKRIYGPRIVERWVEEGLIKVIKDGDNTSSMRIDRLQIESVARTSNRITYLTTKEREKGQYYVGQAK